MPPIEHLVEGGIYADVLDAAEEFYRGSLGLEVLTNEPERHIFFRVGDSVLLVFRPDETLKGGMLPPHGTRGPGHFALGIPTESLDQWREHLNAHGIQIEKEVDWPRGGKSLCFRDPAGNAVEFVTRGLWGLSSGW
ncbi:MAG: glyoxalase/bleomycin resistance/extradiol dioxygenase family protein [Rhodopirellula sp.]|nr:glyoxalase/bleomycin resistance/extradiol dioxygenase family protein [Rhodopirellula sp.]